MAPIDLRKFRYFIAVAEELHFRRAAEKLNMSQPPLSQHIQRLEDEVGAKLFVRKTNTQVRLTPVGERLYEDVRLSIQQAARAVESAQRSARGELGLLRIGYTREYKHGFLPRFVGDFMQSHPDVLLELVEANSWLTLQALETGAIDCGFIHKAPMVTPIGMHCRSLPGLPLCAIFGAGHRFSARSSIAWAELRKERFLMPIGSPSHQEHAWRDEFFNHAGFVPNVACILSSPDMVATLAARDLGFGIGTPDSFGPDRADIRLVPLVDPDVILTRTLLWPPEPDNGVRDRFLAGLDAAFAISISGG